MKKTTALALPLVLGLGAAAGGSQQASALEMADAIISIAVQATPMWGPTGHCATFTWNAREADGTPLPYFYTETVCDGAPAEGVKDGKITRSHSVPVGSTVTVSVACKTPPPGWAWKDVPAQCGTSVTYVTPPGGAEAIHPEYVKKAVIAN